MPNWQREEGMTVYKEKMTGIIHSSLLHSRTTMYTKTLILLAVVAAVSCQRWGNSWGGSGSWDGDSHKDYYAPPHYAYEYKVHDGHTGDIKGQHETRDGDVVKGYYTLKEADGTTREVHYTADQHGTNMEVKRSGHAIHAPAHHGPSSNWW